MLQFTFSEKTICNGFDFTVCA